MKKLIVIIIIAFLTSCASQKKAIYNHSSENSEIFVNTMDKDDIIIIDNNGIKRIKTGGFKSTKVKKEYHYKEYKK